VIPIQDLLHRIRWDGEFGKAQFVIGYYARVASSDAGGGSGLELS
jgi:uncharacterized protein (UPF0248 family)